MFGFALVGILIEPRADRLTGVGALAGMSLWGVGIWQGFVARSTAKEIAELRAKRDEARTKRGFVAQYELSW